MQHYTFTFNNRTATLSEDFFSRVSLTPFDKQHYMVSFNSNAAKLIDLPSRAAHDNLFINYLSGKKVLPGSDPIAMLYAGHQFGAYVSQLGDGRAILLAELQNKKQQTWDLQIKGSGKTPYSRGGDGRAVLRSTIREYLCSEAMHGLGIPTTRALCIIGSDTEVYREQIETGALLARLSPSHIRFGSFEVFFYRQQYQHIKTLADFTIMHHHPELVDSKTKYTDWLSLIVTRTAHLIAQWQAVGFAHGVMNTDNMSILGLTLDYGPFGFMEKYDSAYICNHSDHSGRYAFQAQPNIGLWNLTCLAQALTALIPIDDAKSCLENYESEFINKYVSIMQKKLGLLQNDKNDLTLINQLLDIMQGNKIDYSYFFRHLASFKNTNIENEPQLSQQFLNQDDWSSFSTAYCSRLQKENTPDVVRQKQMNLINPKFILRNYIAEIAIRKATDEKDYSEIDKLLALFSAPYAEHPAMQHYAETTPEWGQQLQLSCSS